MHEGVAGGFSSERGQRGAKRMILLIRFLSVLQSCRLLGVLGISASRLNAFRKSGLPEGSLPGSCVWFHASSMGELEMLRPLIDDLL